MIGIAMILLGAVVMLVSRFTGGKWPIPGDIVIKRDNFTFYFPIATSVIISVVLTLIIWMFSRGRGQ